jgi:hypothetical protein
MLASLATWENFEQLRQQFPCAPAWGHAGTQGGATFIATVPKPTIEGAEEPEPRAAREKRPNPRFAGPEWSR